MGCCRVHFALRIVDSSTYEVYQQKWIMENIRALEWLGWAKQAAE